MDGRMEEAEDIWSVRVRADFEAGNSSTPFLSSEGPGDRCTAAAAWNAVCPSVCLRFLLPVEFFTSVQLCMWDGQEVVVCLQHGKYASSVRRSEPLGRDILQEVITVLRVQGGRPITALTHLLVRRIRKRHTRVRCGGGAVVGSLDGRMDGLQLRGVWLVGSWMGVSRQTAAKLLNPLKMKHF